LQKQLAIFTGATRDELTFVKIGVVICGKEDFLQVLWMNITSTPLFDVWAC
jgi:hypothetical protein